MDTNERYKRHLLLQEIGPEGQRRLQAASVLLVGVGGLGSPIALYLTAAGVGRIGLVDADVVSESNLQRQVLYTEAEIGLPKVRCAEKRLHQLSVATQIDCYDCRLTEENAAELIGQYDIVVDGCDNFATRYLLDDSCHRLNKPYVYGSINEFQGQVSVFNYLGGMRYRDLFPDNPVTTNDRLPGVLGTVPGVVGTLEASEVIKIITGCGEVLRNRLFTIDLLTLETARFDLDAL